MPVSPFVCDPRDPDRDIRELRLVALPSAVPCARALTRAQLRKWRLDSYTAACELVCSELVTNSVAATGSRVVPRNYNALRRGRLAPIAMRLRLTHARLYCEVWDSSGDPPAPPGALADGVLDEGGRGLMLVAAYAADWASYPSPGGGKVVAAWFELRPPDRCDHQRR